MCKEKILKDLKNFSLLCRFVLFLYILIILWLTLFHRSSNHPQTVTPLFHELKLIILRHNSWATIDTIRNIFMLMPFGFLLSETSEKFRKLRRIILLALAFSAFIEFTQLITARGTCEMDDIINNTLGAVIGYYIWIIFNKRKY